MRLILLYEGKQDGKTFYYCLDKAIHFLMYLHESINLQYVEESKQEYRDFWLNETGTKTLFYIFNVNKEYYENVNKAYCGLCDRQININDLNELENEELKKEGSFICSNCINNEMVK